MKDIDVVPLIVDLGNIFFRSSRDALHRAQSAKSVQDQVAEPTGLNIFSHRQNETQASLETIVFAFLTVEATVNYIFFHEQSADSKGVRAWLRDKWKRNLSIHDRFVLLVSQYATGNLNDFQRLGMLFLEFITFRNRIVHAHPEQYQALVEPSTVPNEMLVHDVEPIYNAHNFRESGLSQEIGRISSDDASRAFEIMLLVLCFLDEQFITEFELPWLIDGASREEPCRIRRILDSFAVRHYPEIDPVSFVPEIISKLKQTQPHEEDREK
jgi:hypothetical protein